MCLERLVKFFSAWGARRVGRKNYWVVVCEGGGMEGGGGQYPSCNEFLIIWSMVPSSEKVLIFKISRMEA